MRASETQSSEKPEKRLKAIANEFVARLVSYGKRKVEISVCGWQVRGSLRWRPGKSRTGETENRKWPAVILTCGLLFAAAVAIRAQENKGSERMVAKEPFDVKIAPAETAHKDDRAIARYSLDKVYHGDLEATGTGEMLASTGTVKGSGTYVAMEIVNGTLAGKKGTFALAHIGTQVHGEQNLSINVVPDSGTGELAGISGQLKIVIAGDGKHSYEFEYEIHK